jgi:hypothetical protein
MMGHVYFHVEMIPQGQNPICWIACVAMITSFKTKTTHPISEFTGGFDPSSACIPDPNTGWNDIFVNVVDFPFYGPVCVSVGSGTHALVVNGIDTNTGNVMIVNPWGTTTPPADLDVVVKAMQDISNDGLNPVAYM